MFYDFNAITVRNVFLNLDDGRWVAPITITSLCFYRVSQSNSFLRVFHFNGIVYHITLFRYLLKKISFYLTKQIKQLKIRFTSIIICLLYCLMQKEIINNNFKISMLSFINIHSSLFEKIYVVLKWRPKYRALTGLHCI